MISAQQNKYVQNSIQTASPAQLLIMLSDGAIRFCKQAIEAIHQKNYQDANHFLVKVQDIIQEFVITLDKKAAVADQLLPLYDYFLFRLVEANTKKQAEPAEEVLGYLQELKETWLQAAKLSVGATHG
ncbi:flagellar export chaperone FliS [Paenibacillus pectinilyticus]|uniref:Flagellar secretion chaperone FliS n=1 Tax=Paenibacillus pectinilyticus TaxID=512399 RepID=A0A1C0ZYI2_9BACL|nr:flagellar export chaperone FliS [Paenibacillus pectinilyticus]OCT13157.1 flagellar export chaperone FliS [Paenibacillus pectinilyticus]